ncbi:MAG: 2-oxoacid:acceptor oxidoreductase family protein [Planctomycetes bacterium]|nr:2-oxoacid:acceptor oxidoreductase family protein [Planctomycetota bacterium]
MCLHPQRTQIVILGLGGQGILFVTRVLAEAAISEGWDVLSTETHGMAQRGGAVESHVKFGGFESPLVRLGKADAAIALDRSRADAAQAFLRPDGMAFVNTPEGCDAAAIARELNAPRGANLVLLGRAAAAAPRLFPSRDKILAALERLSPPHGVEANRRAFLKGGEGA